MFAKEHPHPITFINPKDFLINYINLILNPSQYP